MLDVSECCQRVQEVRQRRCMGGAPWRAAWSGRTPPHTHPRLTSNRRWSSGGPACGSRRPRRLRCPRRRSRSRRRRAAAAAGPKPRQWLRRSSGRHTSRRSSPSSSRRVARPRAQHGLPATNQRSALARCRHRLPPRLLASPSPPACLNPSACAELPAAGRPLLSTAGRRRGRCVKLLRRRCARQPWAEGGVRRHQHQLRRRPPWPPPLAL